ncbi:MAG: S9 family peptidase, partial [Verrucomicrobiota bacterium]
MKIFLAVSFSLATSAFAQPAAQNSTAKHPFTFEDMMKLKRVGAPVPSPDGKWVVFDCVDVDLEKNTKVSHLWIVPANGGESRRLSQAANHEERPRFSPDGKRLIWTSKATDPTQIWMSNFDTGSGALKGKAHQVTNISTGADGAIWSPDGKNIVFVSAVYPDCNPPPPGSGVTSDDCNRKRDQELKNSKVKAKIFTRLLYRHWNAYSEFKRSHLFVQNVEAGVSPAGKANAADTAATTPRDLTPGDQDVPPFNLGGQDMYAISPDGKEIAYTSNIDEVEATSTNNEVFIVPMTGPAAAGKKISTSPGSDSTPLYSPDGKYIAWRSQARAGFEADKWRLFVQDRKSGQVHDLTEKSDHSLGSFAWRLDSETIFFTAENHGESPIYGVSLHDNDVHEVIQLHADDLTSCKDGSSIFFSRASIRSPTEIARFSLEEYANASGHGQDVVHAQSVTKMNDPLLSGIDMQLLEPFTFKGANDEDVQGFMIKPPGFDPAKKYPLKFLIHGGPQGAWGNSWTYRWNA